MRKLIRKIEDLVNPFKRNIKVSKAIYNYYTSFDENEFSISIKNLLALHITNVLARYEKGILVVKIELERPDILIGKGGKDLKALNYYLEEELKCLVNLIIVESDLWRFNKY